MSGLLSLEDLFTLGIGFDIAGAYLVACGLLLSVGNIRLVSGSYFDWSPSAMVARVSDRVAATFGIISLVFGFLLQLGGYLAVASGEFVVRSGANRALGAALAALVGLVVPLLAYVVLRRRLQRRLLIRLARFKTADEVADRPYGMHLLAFGRVKGWDPIEDEDQVQYARRVWGVERIYVGGPGVNDNP